MGGVLGIGQGESFTTENGDKATGKTGSCGSHNVDGEESPKVDKQQKARSQKIREAVKKFFKGKIFKKSEERDSSFKDESKAHKKRMADFFEFIKKIAKRMASSRPGNGFRSQSDFEFQKKQMLLALDVAVREAKVRMGLHPNATASQARALYYKLSKELHPDKAPAGADEEMIKQRTAAFQKLNNDYNMIANEEALRDAIVNARDPNMNPPA